jgi:hypothetical protein
MYTRRNKMVGNEQGDQARIRQAVFAYKPRLTASKIYVLPKHAMGCVLFPFAVF